MRRKHRSAACGLVLPLVCLARPAAAACAVTTAGLVACNQNTDTQPTTDKNGAHGSSDSRTQRFGNGAPIVGSIAPGVDLQGAGLALGTTGGPKGAGPSITLTNQGTVAADEKRLGAVALRGPGAVTYRGTGAISNQAGIGLTVDAAGPIAVTIDGSVTGGPVDRKLTPPGADIVSHGAGNIVVAGSGAITGLSGRGLIAQQVGSGGILVTGTGTVAGQGQICPGNKTSLANALAYGKTGCSAIRAVISDKQSTGDVTVNRSGNISGTAAGINAINQGRGNIAVTTGADAKIVGAYEFGIEATSYGSGKIAVTTAAAGSLVSGGDGILAINHAPRIAAAAGSSIDVNAAGTIASGSFPTAARNDDNPTGVLAGISAGYVGGARARPNGAVNGSVAITNAATIGAKTGDGILGFNFGVGSLAITSSTAVTAEAGTGIAARTSTGPMRIDVTGANAIVTGTGPRHAALNATTTRGAVDVTVGAGATLRGLAGAVGAKITGSAAPSAAPRTLVNDGTIIGSGTGVVGSGLTIVNDGTIEGGAGAPAVAFVGGVDRYSGAGSIPGGIAVTGSAAFTPAPAGSPVGTGATIVGPLSFASTASYLVRATPTTADALTVVGAATLGGAGVNIASIGAAAPGTRFTILTATGGLAGRFGQATSNLAFYTPTLSYDANSVTLTSRYDFAAPALTRNEAAVGAALTIAAAGGGGRVARALDQAKAGQGAAILDSLSGDGIAAAETVALRSSQLFTSTIFDQTTFYGAPANSVTLAAAPVRELADLPSRAAVPAEPIVPARTWRAWATGFGGTQDIGAAAGLGTAAQASTIYGGVLGVDYALTPGTLVGLAVGGSDGAFQVGQRATSGSTTGGHIALYDVATLGPWYAASSLALSIFDNRTSRQVGGPGALGGLGGTEHGTFDSTELRGRLEVGRSVAGLVTPFVALEGATLRSQGFAETTASGPGLLGLTVAGRSTDSLPAFVGARAAHTFAFGNGMVFTPIVQAAYVHEFVPDRQLEASIADLPGATFLVDGARPSRNAAQVKVGGALALGRGVVVFANFDAEVSSLERAYTGKGGLAVTW